MDTLYICIWHTHFMPKNLPLIQGIISPVYCRFVPTHLILFAFTLLYLHIKMMYNPSIYCKIYNSQFILQDMTGIIHCLQQLYCMWTHGDHNTFLCLLSSIYLQETWRKPSDLCVHMRVCMCVFVFPFRTLTQPDMSCSVFCPWIFQSPWKVSNVNVSTVYQ